MSAFSIQFQMALICFITRIPLCIASAAVERITLTLPWTPVDVL